jgi:putative ABC transport system permease protein
VLARRANSACFALSASRVGQIGAMLAAEGGFLALLGVAAGLVLGALISLVLVYVVNRQSFNWSMDLHPPYRMLAGLSSRWSCLPRSLRISLAAKRRYGSGARCKGDW